MKSRAPSLTFVFITLLLDVLGFGLLIPVSPKLIAMAQGLPIEGHESETSVEYGLLLATYAVMQFFFAPVLGSLSDRFGRRPVILISLLGSGLDYFVAAAVPTLSVLFITRAINGISGANITACSAYIADVTPPEKRAAGFGILGAAFGIGFILGPLAGGLLGAYDIRLPYIAAGVLTLINCAYGYFVLPESLPQNLRRPFSWRKANAFGSLAWMCRHRVVITLAATLFLLNVAQFALHSTWVLSMGARFHWTTTQVGLSLCVVGITSAIVQGGLARKLIPAIGERVSILIGLITGIFAFAGYALATEGWMIYAIIAAASIGGIAGPALQGVVSKAVSPTEQGLLQGALNGLQSVAAIIGYLSGTAVFHYFTKPDAPANAPGAPFLMGSILAALSIIPVAFAWRLLPKRVRELPVDAETQTPGDSVST